MEIFELRSRHRLLILSFHMETGEWHKKLSGGAIADAVLDRAILGSWVNAISRFEYYVTAKQSFCF